MSFILTHLRIASAFCLREMSTRYGKSPGGYFWALGEPLGYIIMMSILFHAIARSTNLPGGFTLFFATGYFGYHLFRGTADYATPAISANKNLLTYPVVAPFDPLVARLFLQAMTFIVVSTIILGPLVLTTRQPIYLNWEPLLLALAIGLCLGASVAMVNASLFPRYPIYQKLYDILMRPLLLVSGVFYLPSSLPLPYRDYVLMNPITHLVILFRRGFYGNIRMDGLDLAFLLETTAVVGLLGIFLFTFYSPASVRD